MDVNYINELLKEGKSVKEVRNIIGSNEKAFQREIKALGYKYNQKLKQYEPTTVDDKSMTQAIKPSKNVIVLDDDKCMTIDIQQDLKNNIVNLANDYEKIQEVLKWFENRSDDESMTEVIEVINEGIKINLPEAEVIRTTIRINKATWNKFKKFAEDHKEFNQQDLMAQALEDYMNKHK